MKSLLKALFFSMYIDIKYNTIKHHYDVDNAITRLYKDVAKYKPLTKEAERILIQAGKNGDIVARNKVICSNIKFAIAVAKGYKDLSIPLEDLISEALIALTKAFDTYDLKRDTKFITHAVWHIRDHLSCSQGSVVKKPNTYRVLRKTIRRKQESLEQKYSGEIPTDMLAEELEVNKYYLQDYLAETQSLDMLQEENHFDLVMQGSPFHELSPMDYFETLPEDTQYIVGWKTGMFGPAKTSKLLAKEKNISVSEVERLYNKAITFLKNNLIDE